MNARVGDRARRSAPRGRLIAALLLLAASACEPAPPPSQEQEPNAPSQQAPDSVPEPGQPSDSLAEPVPPRVQDWTSGIVGVPPAVQAAEPIPIVRAVRSAAHDGFDRVTIELAGTGMPGYHAEYVDKPLHQCGSGAEVFPVGQGWLEIRLEPAQAHTEEGAATLPARELEATGRLLRRIYVTCDFEGVVSLVLALDSPNPYQVSTLASPTRIVVDVRH